LWRDPIAQPAVSTGKTTTCQSDSDLWQQGVAAISQLVGTMPPPLAAIVKSAVGELMALKSAMHAIVEAVDGTPTCAVCGGMCCRCGKYHFAAIDLVAYLVTGKELFAPSFGGEGCTFLHRDHCLMPPDYRPFNCITFVCELLEEKFSGEEKVAFYALERELRSLYQQLQQFFSDPRMARSVMSFVQG
jgi:hypothetical protein